MALPSRLATAATLDPAPPAISDGTLEVTELAGPPLVRDTVQVSLVECIWFCPIVSAQMRGNRIQLLDAQGYEATVIRPTFGLTVVVTDYSADPQSPLPVAIAGGGDSEILELQNVPGSTRFAGIIDVIHAAAVPDSGYLEPAPGSTLTASVADPLGLSSATDSATVADDYAYFVDRNGNPVRHVALDGPVRFHFKAPAANLDDFAADTLIVEARVYGLNGYVRDLETLVATETGMATETFAGQLPSRLVSGGPGTQGDGLLQSATGDHVHVRAGAAYMDAMFLPGLVRFVDAGGADVSEIFFGSVYVELESFLADQDDNSADQTTVSVQSQNSWGFDQEALVLTEQGVDSALFRGSLPAAPTAPIPFNSKLEGPVGAFVTVSYEAVGDNDIDFAYLAVHPNRPPQAVGDNVATPEDQLLLVDPLANDSDPDFELPILQSWTQAARGTVAAVPGNPSQLRYTPAANYFGSDSFSYTIADAAGLTASATVSLTVSPVDDPPVAASDSVTVNEDSSISIRARLNDTDPEGDAIAVVRFDSVSAHGTIAVSSGLYDFRYIPAANYFGSDSFTYEIEAGGLRATGTVTVTVNPVPDLPIAVADSVTTLEGTPVTIAVLANDRDPDGQTFSIYSVTNSSGLNLTLGPGTVTYTPAAGFYGGRYFTYRIRDSGGAISLPATVTLNVEMINDPPVAVDDVLFANEDQLTSLSVLANDSDPDGLNGVQIGIVTQPSHGTATVVGGLVRYLSAPEYSGPDAFTYKLTDSGGLMSSTATVNLTVRAVNDSPVLTIDYVTIPEDTTVVIYPLENDTDIETPESLVLLGLMPPPSPSLGTATIDGNSIVFTPAPNYHGLVLFSYRASDGQSEGGPSEVVWVTVEPVNDPPAAAADAASLAEDGSVTIAVLANDSDVEGDPLAVVAAGTAAYGTVGFTASSVVYTPAANYHGPDAFTYTVADGQGGSTAASVSVVVAPANDPPVAADDSATTDAGDSVTVAVLLNDSDLDGDVLAVTGVGAPLHGSAVHNGDGTVTYTPAAGYSGADSFGYTMGDGSATATATVSITVEGPQLSQVSVLALRSVWIENGADILSGDVVANTAGGPPYLGATELAFGSGITMAAGYSARGNGVTIATGTTIAADVVHNTLDNGGTITGAAVTPLALPVFATLPPLLTGTPGTADVNVAQNAAITLAPGAYRDLIVAKRGVVTFSGGVYTFRSITIAREASLLFAAPGIVKVEGRMSTATMTKIQPGPGSTATPATIEFHVAGINGSNGYLASTPKSVEIATDNVLNCNFYVPNGTLWLQARTVGLGAFVGKNVRVGPDVQIGLASAW